MLDLLPGRNESGRQTQEEQRRGNCRRRMSLDPALVTL